MVVASRSISDLAVEAVQIRSGKHFLAERLTILPSANKQCRRKKTVRCELTVDVKCELLGEFKSI